MLILGHIQPWRTHMVNGGTTQALYPKFGDSQYCRLPTGELTGLAWLQTRGSPRPSDARFA